MAGSVSINKHKPAPAQAPSARSPALGDAPAAFRAAASFLCCDFHGFARWQPYGPDMAAAEKAEDGWPRTDYNVAHHFGGTGS